MAAQHTPGPWEACDPGDYSDFDGDSRVILGNDMRIAVAHWHPGNTRAENDANARLIAAAPELFAALTAAKQEMWLAARATWNMSDFKNWAVVQQIDAALEKADGKPRTAAACAKLDGQS